MIKSLKNVGGKLTHFCLGPKVKLNTETHVLHSAPKFLYFLVHFYTYCWFWYQTEIVPEKVYAVIWPVLEITSLKVSMFSDFLDHKIGFTWLYAGYSVFYLCKSLQLRLFPRSNQSYKVGCDFTKSSSCFQTIHKFRHQIWNKEK